MYVIILQWEISTKSTLKSTWQCNCSLTDSIPRRIFVESLKRLTFWFPTHSVHKSRSRLPQYIFPVLHLALDFTVRCLLEFRQNSTPDYYSTPDCYSDDKSNINQAKINITYKHILDAMNIYKLRYSYNSLFSKLMKILNIYIF